MLMKISSFSTTSLSRWGLSRKRVAGTQDQYLGSALEAFLEADKAPPAGAAADEAAEVGVAMLQLARLCHLIVQVRPCA